MEFLRDLRDLPNRTSRIVGVVASYACPQLCLHAAEVPLQNLVRHILSEGRFPAIRHTLALLGHSARGIKVRQPFRLETQT